MLFRNTALVAPSSDDARDTLQILWPTAAEPATFAPPVEVTEDERSITILFDLAGHAPEAIEVEMRSGTVFVLGGRAPAASSRLLRVFALGARIDPSAVEAEATPGRLSVRIGKVPPGSRAIVLVKK
ncbi:Hsp20/alpha crystallin family protein [Sorangium sp. So ce131]|uniref:Hsp20/alpha crystallin family protein n=1 Tax=Sorangium sp. So ce131 TaxID=3133282 RepID=UPI003F6171EE